MVSADLAALYGRDLTRLLQEVRAFPDTASLWAVAPGVSNAAGTLALHLEGNLREYVGRQLGKVPYTRNRPLEFSARGIEHGDLVNRLTALQEDIPPIIAALTPSQLDADFPEVLFGKPMTTHQMLVHLSGHLNYHLGQVDYLRRFVTGNAAIELAGL